MDIDRKVKINALIQNNSMREKICYCGCRITKLNKNEFTLDKCNNEECNFNHSKFDKYTKDLKAERREERNNRLIEKYGQIINPILRGLLFPILIPLNIYYCIVTEITKRKI